jgi:hypothetical protein
MSALLQKRDFECGLFFVVVVDVIADVMSDVVSQNIKQIHSTKEGLVKQKHAIHLSVDLARVSSTTCSLIRLGAADVSACFQFST